MHPKTLSLLGYAITTAILALFAYSCGLEEDPTPVMKVIGVACFAGAFGGVFITLSKALDAIGDRA